MASPSGRPNPMTLTRASALGLALLLAATAIAAMPVQATDSNPGTIKVHDSVNVEPPQRNQPHVPCDSIFIEGFMMADSSGTLEFTSWPPTGDKTVVLTAEWSADANGHFVAGPFTLAEGHYRVEAFSSTGHPGGNTGHFAKAKMFWAECPPVPPEPPVDLPCPPATLSATANADGTVTLAFAAAAGADGTNIYRLDADGDWQLLATVGANATTYSDVDVEVGVTYTYTVTALFGNRESEDCAIVEVTTIPEFPTMVAAGLAGALGLVAYAVARRRK